jgi:hypothetical protein
MGENKKSKFPLDDALGYKVGFTKGETKFIGMEFTLKDGSTKFVEAHPEVKKSMNKFLKDRENGK